jgi:acyl-CoA dehydrogenase
MNFEPSDEIRMLLENVRRYVDNELIPLEEKMAREGRDWPDVEPTLARLRAENKARGWWLPQIPKEHGGQGLSVVDHGLLCAELGRSPFGFYVFNCQAPDAGNIEILIEYGTPEQKAKYLQRLLDGEIRSCFSMTEPEHAGSNPVHMSTRAVKDGEDWVINGHKWFTSSADGAEFAIVMAVTDLAPNANPYLRSSMIIVPTDTPGFHIERNISVMGHSGSGYPTHAEVRYENCRVPVANTLGGEKMAFAIAQDRLGPGRIHHCMRWIGICERCFEIMVDYAAVRELNPGQPLATRQFVQGWIAESRAEINAARLMVLEAAWKIDRIGKKAAREDVSLIKFHVAGVMQRVIDRALQTLGGAGMTDDFPLSFYYRHERAARIYDGPDEVHKISAAKQILRRYAERKK